LKYFAQVLDRNGIPERGSFAFIHEVRDVVAAKTYAKDITDTYEFQRKTPGYLQLRLSQSQQPDHGHFELITWQSQRYSILKGCYVAPHARSIFRDHAALVAGFRMDTTWRIIRLDAASILTVVTGNVGIPIVLGFGSDCFNCRSRRRYQIVRYILRNAHGVIRFHFIGIYYQVRSRVRPVSHLHEIPQRAFDMFASPSCGTGSRHVRL
jgi:hypothetical protein